ncbi:MAG: ABC transporter ATP-binding protein [Acetobacter aceti]|uniref:ABC transporter ATP-binding protein n=1 Tax=Acetobacter aceti TaxID=435 RepID=A0A1U9KDM6_ACEAC|nr:ABC transporter ATP-binding protein [Acetobacter aceti]AQS83837.1 ABC transporter ATP-binding protein [Acetobacter aceti]
MTLLDIRGLSARYDRGADVLKSVSLSMREGEILAIIGANGAGKSTLLLTLLGALAPSAGSVWWQEHNMTGMPVHECMKNGLVLVPEGRRIIASLSIQDNLLLGAHLRRDRKAIHAEMDAIYDRFPNLAKRRHWKASGLSGGELQMLAIGRALLARPRLLMLDEPSLGLSPLFVERLFDLIREINQAGTSILLVEQNTGMALALADQAAVMELGCVTMAGPAAELATDPRLQAAYLGLD